MQLDTDLQLLREVRNGVGHLGLEAERADDLPVPFPPGVRSSSWPSSTSRIWAYFGNKTRWVAEVYRGSVPGEVMVNGPDDVYVERKGRITRGGERRHEDRLDATAGWTAYARGNGR
jgi:hypothetical protein